MAYPERVGDVADEVEEVEEEEETTGVDGVTSQILRRPDVLAALQGRLHAEMLESLPASVKRRIKSLKKLQLEATYLEAKFYEEVHLLEMKYHKLFTPLFEKRSEIISGQYEPTDVECQWDLDDDKDEELCDEMKNKVKIEEVETVKKEESESKNEDVKGIPDFWLTIFKNVQMLAEMVQEHDEPILKHLIDIKVVFHEANPMGFTLEFYFSPNEFFTNSVLTKVYEMKCTPDEGDPFSFEGPEIYKCKGCAIDWKKGMNVTVKVIKKKQKHKSRGSVRTVTKTVQNDSFFNFFSPPCMPEDPEAEIDEETQALLTSDFEIGHYIRERIVPRAILYFTGEALEDEDYEEEEEGEEDEEEEDDDEDPSYTPKNNRLRNQKNVNPADCKQQ
ncbi:nucleosome assembly protein 1-like 1 [Anabrus simplex]|uniref:nucleosome assembly protein 1-like 1 n=1 Tax=Anabrus simplex TaxID=316456 RepID=UPI0034DD63D2